MAENPSNVTMTQMVVAAYEASRETMKSVSVLAEQVQMNSNQLAELICKLDRLNAGIAELINFMEKKGSD